MYGGEGMYPKQKFIFTIPKKFYSITELEGEFNMSRNELIKNAVLCGAMYQISSKRLINRVRLEEFFARVGNLAAEIDRKYSKVKDVSAYFDLQDDQVIQLASDAKALIKIRGTLLVNLEELENYISEFKCEMNTIDPEKSDEIEKIKRRSERLCVR